MQVHINGLIRELNAPGGALTVAQMLESIELRGRRFAVERNGEVIPKGQHASTPVIEGDRFEVIVAVGGG